MSFRDLLPLVAALSAAILIWVLRERHRRRTEIRPPAPDATLAEAAQSFLLVPHPDAPLLAPTLAPPAPAELEEIERQTLADAHPRLALRRAILDSAGMALHLEAMARLPESERAMLLQGYQPGMDPALRQAHAEALARSSLLRHYARLKYDDAVPDDWFEHFLHIAGPYIAEKVRLARDFLVRVDEGAGRFAEIYDALLDELRRELLKAPPKKRFPPPDLPAPAGARGQGPGAGE